MYQLNEQDQQFLLELSRQTLQHYLTARTTPKPSVTSEELRQKRGAFVTLHERGQLRGCIGYVMALYPLYETVIECSVAAATQDPRFMPVELEELAAIDIEISVLSPLEKVTDPETIQAGLHGLVISQHGCRGLLLPQVAVEYRMDRKRFLQETCRKAGLPPDAWEKGAEIECFTAFVFGELQGRRAS